LNKIIFLVKINFLIKNCNNIVGNYKQEEHLNFNILTQTLLNYFLKNYFFKKPKKLVNTFLVTTTDLIRLQKPKKLFTIRIQKYFVYLYKYILTFLEKFFNMSIILHIKKGSNFIFMKRISTRSFYRKYFRRFLNVNKQIIGVLYYSLLLKDASIFINFLKRILNITKIKLHKKVFYSLKKILRKLFKPLFRFLGVAGVFFNIKGKIGVSGNAKKRRYFFFLGEHKTTTRTMKMDYKFTTITTFTGTLGMSFTVFF